MRSADNIRDLLEQLDRCAAHDLEDQDLDFKQWDLKSRENSVKLVVKMAVCMANGGGGTVVFGVADRILNRSQAVLGVPLEIDSNMLKKAVYDQTDPKITPVFEELFVREGTGRLLLMQIYPGMPPYTDTAGRGTIRISKDCVPLTGTLRQKLGTETGETDYTAQPVAKIDTALLSAVALEALRNQASRERAPADLLQLSDVELLSALGLIRHEKLTRAAIMLAGTEAAIKEYLPGHNWTFLEMISDTDYGIREDKVSALPLSVQRLEELLVPFNRITTRAEGFYHFEHLTWPVIAVREALMNAFCHADLRMAGPIMVKLHAGRLEVSNNGNFIGGITPSNILHHQPAARNPAIVEALTRLRLVNRSNLGISRMFAALLVEGKDPPRIREVGGSVFVKLPKSELNANFRKFVAEESDSGHVLSVDELIVLQHLLKNSSIDKLTAAFKCQRSESETGENLKKMALTGYIEDRGTKPEPCWSLHSDVQHRLNCDVPDKAHRCMDWIATKDLVLAALKDRHRHNEPGLTNKEIRQMTQLDRNQTYRLMFELRQEHPEIRPPGRGKYARYELDNA